MKDVIWCLFAEGKLAAVAWVLLNIHTISAEPVGEIQTIVPVK